MSTNDVQLKTVDEELSQSRARVVITAISLVAYSAISWHKGLDQGTEMLRGLAIIIGYLTFSATWYVMVYRNPGRLPWRRYITILSDLGIMTYWLHMGDRHVASFYPIFLWVIIGNGIRFGERYLKFAIAVGTVGFGSLLVFNEFWKNHLEIGSGLLLGVLVLPAFFLTVLGRLRTMNELKLALARGLRARREQNGLAQREVALRTGSSQSRVAKMEAADDTVTVDLLIRALLSLGASRSEVARLVRSG